MCSMFRARDMILHTAIVLVSIFAEGGLCIHPIRADCLFVRFILKNICATPTVVAYPRSTELYTSESNKYMAIPLVPAAPRFSSSYLKLQERS